MAVRKRRRHTPDQVIRKLAEGHRLLAGGQGLDGGVSGVGGRGVDVA